MMWKFFGRKEPWYTNAVVYQIYPWSFKDSNNDGIGDLEGIIEKLEYVHDLGVDAIWISPIYPSPMKDFGYDVSDYCDIDTRFGTLKIFDTLVHEAHKRNIKIILDLVTNHTSSEHAWFKESRSSKNNPKRNWYVWHDPKPDGSAPNNWLSVSGGSAWTFDQASGQYYLHQFLAEQPDLNWRNEEMKKEMKKVMEFWMKRGVDGFRVDAMSHFIEDAEFRDDPVNPHYVAGKDDPYWMFIHTQSDNLPETNDVIRYLCEIANTFPERFIVTESYLPLADMIKVYDAVPVKNHAPFNFKFIDKNAPWSVQAYRDFIDTFDKLVGPGRIPTYVLGNHDNSRLVSRLDPGRARLSAMLLLTLRGMAYIYYGEELGMSDTVIPKSSYRDGFATVSPIPTQSRDPERTPMQWDTSANAGFSTQTPWLPISENYKDVNVETESKPENKDSFLNLYRTLLHLRTSTPALRKGSYISLDAQSPWVFFYKRSYKKSDYYIMLNMSDQLVTEVCTFENIKILCSTHMDLDNNVANKEIKLRPYEGVIFM